MCVQRAARCDWLGVCVHRSQSKAKELLETRIKIFGDAFFEKAFADGDKRDSNLETIDEDEEKSGHK